MRWRSSASPEIPTGHDLLDKIGVNQADHVASKTIGIFQELVRHYCAYSVPVKQHAREPSILRNAHVWKIESIREHRLHGKAWPYQLLSLYVRNIAPNFSSFPGSQQWESRQC
jgi:hypothetical protein